MDGSNGAEREFHCASCGKGRSEVQKLLFVGEGCFVCDECVYTLYDMLRMEEIPRVSRSDPVVPVMPDDVPLRVAAE